MSELDRIKAITDDATEGPWSVNAFDAGHSRYETNIWIEAPNGDVLLDMDGLERSHNEVFHDDGMKDARFVANARSFAPRLIAAIQSIATIPELGDSVNGDQMFIDGWNAALDEVRERLEGLL